MPVVAFRLTPVKGEDGVERARNYDEYDVMWRIREFRWMVPAYSFPTSTKFALQETIMHELSLCCTSGDPKTLSFVFTFIYKYRCTCSIILQLAAQR
jgi:hypothetical protein